MEIKGEYKIAAPRGKVFAAWARCRFKDGTEISEVMDRDEIEAVRKRSRAANDGPWVTDWNEMAKKTVFRRLSKWIPLSAELRESADYDEMEPAAAPRLEGLTAELAGILETGTAHDTSGEESQVTAASARAGEEAQEAPPYDQEVPAWEDLPQPLR